ncbi:hypothetical protein UUU_14070 [Klebsiella pneumoniae subsp. pneumoniae DSM 30104 = JCM 1662 = NBRC 14940]|nr:hypothetical protein UUU_14070 [Klebsiella pneumoniae subsp. pneumoniae DSM 30104 = JCM 1662 = NBRC 14940]
MSCVPTLTRWSMRQSKLTRAASSRGQPVAPVCQSAAAKRSSIAVLPPNSVDRASCPAARVLTHSVWCSLNTGHTEAERFRQTSRVGGVSVTLQTALAVNPARPTGPSVVIMLTAAPTWAMASRKLALSVNSIVNSLCQQAGFIKGQARQAAVQLAGVAIADVHQQVAFPAVVGKKCRVDFFPVKTGHWPGVEAPRPAGKNQIRRLQGAVAKRGLFRQLRAGGKPAAGVTVGKQGRQPVVEGAIPRHDGGHRRLHGFLQIAAGERRAKFLFAFRAAHEHDARWRTVGGSRPHFHQVPDGLQLRIAHRLIQPAVVGPGLGKQRLAGRVVYRVVHRVSLATGSIADSPSRKMVLKVSASVTLQAWPPHGISTSWLPGIAVCSTREQEAGTSRSSAALIISVGQAMADARREKSACFRACSRFSRFSLP